MFKIKSIKMAEFTCVCIRNVKSLADILLADHGYEPTGFSEVNFLTFFYYYFTIQGSQLCSAISTPRFVAADKSGNHSVAWQLEIVGMYCSLVKYMHLNLLPWFSYESIS